MLMPQKGKTDLTNVDVVLFSKGGRDFRAERMSRGEEVPREFFYGFYDLMNVGFSAAMLSSAGRQPGTIGFLADVMERAFSRATSFGARPMSTRLSLQQAASAKVVISYTDGFSLSLGLSGLKGAQAPILIGGFHGLSDIEEHAPYAMRNIVRKLISRAIANLDHVFFFGAADRNVSIERYGTSPTKSSIFKFGVDTEFWRPMPEEEVEDFVVAIGQDRNRDYDLLASAPGNHPTRIVTRQQVKVPANSTNVRTSVGDFFGSDAMTDSDLRRLYNKALAVVVPLKDVYQPSGYSVTLQAMSCGKPVILSQIKGLWTPDILRSEENCLLVRPGDAVALGGAIGRLRADPQLRDRLGRAARQTALSHFSLTNVAESTLALAQLGLDQHAQRGSAVS